MEEEEKKKEEEAAGEEKAVERGESGKEHQRKKFLILRWME